MRMSQISCFLFSIPKSLLFPQGCLLTLACLISLYNMNCLISTFSNNFDSSSKFLNCVRLCFIRAPTSYFCLLQFKPEIRTCSILVLGSSFSMELILKVCSKPNQSQPFFFIPFMLILVWLFLLSRKLLLVYVNSVTTVQPSLDSFTQLKQPRGSLNMAASGWPTSVFAFIFYSVLTHMASRCVLSPASYSCTSRAVINATVSYRKKIQDLPTEGFCLPL